jgi:hypothetical protein
VGGTVEHGVNVLAAALIDACGAQMDAERRQGDYRRYSVVDRAIGLGPIHPDFEKGYRVSPSQGLKPTPGYLHHETSTARLLLGN